MEPSSRLKTTLAAAVAAVGAAMARPGPPEDAQQRIIASWSGVKTPRKTRGTVVSATVGHRSSR